MPTMDWLNRDAAFKIAKDVPYRLLEAVSEHQQNGAGTDSAVEGGDHGLQASQQTTLPLGESSPPKPLEPTHNNLLIQGDNLEALKALLPFYRGQVKCIFIDPPYNTKSAFEHYDDNLEHAQWLSMMLPRLQLLRELLREDGSMWVTIDDNEGHYLKVLMDEVFGRGNFVANVVWQKKYAPANDALWLSDSHDHILVFAKRKDIWRPNKLARTEEQNSLYKNPDKDPRGPWMSDNYTCAKSADERPNLFYPVTNPNTGEEIWPKRTRVWAFDSAAHAKHIESRMLYWGKDGTNSTPRLKKFLGALRSEGRVSDTIWLHSDVGHTQDARREQQSLDANAPFSTPKPEALLSRIVEISTGSHDLILDSFLGSGTTAAVAQKMGRRWIGIEMGEHAKTHCVPRLQKVIDGEQGGISKAVNWQGGGSFRFMQLGAPVFDESGAIHSEVRFKTLAAFIWMQETRTPWRNPKKGSSPFLGTHNGVAYYLLFNGILGDRRPQGGNVLTRAVLDWLTMNFSHAGQRVIYGESVRVGQDRLSADNVVFRSIPHEVEAR